ncbi:DUF427 domain-containing protein [Streptomyces sp. NPDC090108]|uniref:DUF427 domain-containing protein n=1 Tax=Streptomyces sp. NPDC090108 TaxID=3365947 RepID=UPI0037FCCD9C
MSDSPARPPDGRPRPAESVWRYPRPPAVVSDDRRVLVTCAGVTVADTREAVRVLETSHPPVFYLPPQDVRTDLLVPAPGSTWCEWKGRAVYWDLVVDGEVRARAAWSYPRPTSGYERLTDHFAFYPTRAGLCTVDGEPVVAQEGDFYGGWITAEIEGPFKGGAGTTGW